jgi:hypothetical protein
MRKSMSIGTAIALLVLALLLIVVGPLVSIWALNTLFGLGIQYSVATWAAAAWCTMLFSSSAVSKASKN